MPNTCNCPTPPGGIVICETNQLAICIIKDGEAIHRCLNPPHNRFYKEYHAIEIVNWTIEQIIDENRNPSEKIENIYFDILRSGKFVSNKFSVAFSLPAIIQKAIDELDNGLSNYNTNKDDLIKT